ncbi:MAG: VWA domain-containing protein [Planctomycetaceae bacterium]|jgi:Mg-chelatase subunit ChlD|nr:VWA domain-containing protein [Planctomycetaceae bacterium]
MTVDLFSEPFLEPGFSLSFRVVHLKRKIAHLKRKVGNPNGIKPKRYVVPVLRKMTVILLRVFRDVVLSSRTHCEDALTQTISLSFFIVVMIFFQQPIWFFLLIPIVCSFYFWRIPTRFLTCLRFVIFFLIVLAMTQPMFLLPARRGTIIVIADRSRSMPNDAATTQKLAINLLLQHIGIAQDGNRLGVVSFGAKSLPERLPAGRETGTFGEFTAEIQSDASNLSNAIETALSLIPLNNKGRLLILSDGRWTGNPPTQLVSQLVQRGIAVDYRVIERPIVGDIAILSLDAPDRVLPEEVFKITGWVYVPVAQETDYELFQNNILVAAGTRSLVSGNNRFEFFLKAGNSGVLSCELRVRGHDNDPVPENNSARKLVGVEGEKPILILVPPSATGSPPASKLAAILGNSAITTEIANGSEIHWSLPFLSRYSGIVLDNIPSSSIGISGMELIAAWLKQTGSGLMLTGGKNSYALGGYYQSPLDAVLPLSMELRKEHRKLAVAIAILMDRSGSMGMVVPDGRIKMDLANLGAAEVLNILTPFDEVAVLTCDTHAQTIIPLKQNSNPQNDRHKILSIAPGGGGIFVYVGLSAASKILARANADTKHIILFTDADDTEQPEDYVRLLTACKNAGITCSVIALGTENGATAELCKNIANIGGGNIYFTEHANDLPRLFALDTFTVARSTFLEDATPFHFTGGIITLTGTTLSTPPNLGGYNLCYLKSGALASAVTDDDYQAPIIASWQAGLGRVLCYTGQVDGSYTGSMASWQDYPSMLTSLVRWTAGRTEELPNNMLLTQHLNNGTCQIRLHLDPELNQPPTTTPSLSILKQTSDHRLETENIALHWLEPSLLGTNIALTGNETIQATILLTEEGNNIPKRFQLPPVCLPYSPEFSPTLGNRIGQNGANSLQQLATMTGGHERLDLPKMWNDIPNVPRYFDLSSCFIYAAIICLVAEIFQRRTGWISAWGNRWSNKIRPNNRQLLNSNNNNAKNNNNPKTISLSLFRRFAPQNILRHNHSENSTPPSTPSVPATTEKQNKEQTVPSDGVSDALQKAKHASQNRIGK